MTKRYDELRRFIMPEVMFGPGAIDLVGPCAANLGLNRVLVVSDPGAQEQQLKVLTQISKQSNMS
ncbi:hypothetical protein [Dethiosulfovibrio salsuginis]|nr:hypothetical protein [Dethiosulfovibrio salsuginis]